MTIQTDIEALRARIAGVVADDEAEAPPTRQALPEPFYHEESGAVRFWVRTAAGDVVGAMVRTEALRYRFRAAAGGADALRSYRNHQHEIDMAVQRRIAAGSIEPVILREADFDGASAPLPR